MAVKNPPGFGTPKVIVLGDPAAGAQYTTQTVPAGKAWAVVGFEGTLVTTAGGSARFFTIDMDDGTNVFHIAPAAGSQAASLTRNYHGGENIPSLAVDVHITVTIPRNLLVAGERVVFKTTNLAGGDNWGFGFLRVYEYDNRED